MKKQTNKQTKSNFLSALQPIHKILSELSEQFEPFLNKIKCLVYKVTIVFTI